MLAALLVAALIGSPSSGTIPVDGGMTSSSRSITLPAAPSWATSVRVRVRHVTSITFSWETDSYGGPVTWSADAAIRAGWTLRDASGPVSSARVQATTVQGGLALPYDGTFDGAGASGAHDAHVLASSSPWQSIPIPSAPLVLSTRAQSAWSIWISAPYIPPSGGTVTWLNSTTWTAEVDWMFE